MATKTKKRARAHPFKVEEVRKVEISPIEVSPVGPTPAPWLTLETVLYAVIFVLALALRFWRLGVYPLSNAEAEQGLTALALYRGVPLPAGHYSPLLLSLNTLSFLLFGTSEASARLASLLVGSVLVWLPLTLRRRLGAPTCLLASALLAISPVAVFLSRTLNSEIAVAAGALMVAAGFFNWIEEGRQYWLLLMAAGLALLLVAGPLAYSIILVFGLLALIKLSTFKALWARGVAQAALAQPVEPASLPAGDDGSVPLATDEAQPPGARNPARAEDRAAGLADGQQPTAQTYAQTGSSNLAAFDDAPASSQGSGPGDSAQAERSAGLRPALTVAGQAPNSQSAQSALRKAAIFFVVTVILLATTATFNLSGFGVAATFLGDWLNYFGFQARPEAGFNAVFLLTIYEPLLVLAGLTGIAYAILRQRLPELFFAGWFVGLLLLDMVMGGRPNGSVIILLVPLVFLAAIALVELGQGLQQGGSWGNEGLLLVSGLAIAGFGYIRLTEWTLYTCGPEDRFCQFVWLQSVVALGLFLVVVVFFGLMSDFGVAGRGAALTGVAIGLLAMVSIGWRLNYGPLRHLGYQPLAGIPPSTELVALSQTLASQSEKRVGDATLLDTTLVGLTSPALRWRLRDYGHLQQVDSIFESPLTSAVITPANPGQELSSTEPYVGQDFALDALWSPAGLSPKELVKWLIYRQSSEQPQGNRVVLWLRQEPN